MIGFSIPYPLSTNTYTKQCETTNNPVNSCNNIRNHKKSYELVINHETLCGILINQLPSKLILKRSDELVLNFIESYAIL